MNKILAAIDNSAACCPVLATATALAPTFNARVQAVQIADKAGQTTDAGANQFGIPLDVTAGDPLERIVDLAGDDDVVAVVVGSRSRPGGRRPAGHIAIALADRLDKPVIMVAPDSRLPDKIDLVLLAMEGTPGKSRSLRRAINIAADAGVELVVVHVDDEDSIPSFSDQVQHETAAYSQEFLTRFVGGATAARLETRVGTPATEILACADEVRPALVALGWPQGDDPRRGAVVREVLDKSPVPVLLVAVE